MIKTRRRRANSKLIPNTPEITINFQKLGINPPPIQPRCSMIDNPSCNKRVQFNFSKSSLSTRSDSADISHSSENISLDSLPIDEDSMIDPFKETGFIAVHSPEQGQYNELEGTANEARQQNVAFQQAMRDNAIQKGCKKLEPVSDTSFGRITGAESEFTFGITPNKTRFCSSHNNLRPASPNDSRQEVIRKLISTLPALTEQEKSWTVLKLSEKDQLKRQNTSDSSITDSAYQGSILETSPKTSSFIASSGLEDIQEDSVMNPAKFVKLENNLKMKSPDSLNWSTSTISDSELSDEIMQTILLDIEKTKVRKRSVKDELVYENYLRRATVQLARENFQIARKVQTTNFRQNYESPTVVNTPKRVQFRNNATVHSIDPVTKTPKLAQRAQSFDRDIDKILTNRNKSIWKRFGRSRNSFKASNNFKPATSFIVHNYTTKNSSRHSLPELLDDDVVITDERIMKNPSLRKKIGKIFSFL